MAELRTEVLQGTLDLMVLKALEAVGPLHGYGIARRLEQVSWGRLRLNEGTVYTALMRLNRQGFIAAAWGASENNRRARFYALTKAGRTQLATEVDKWERLSAGVNLLLQRT
jgi:transcriptional regulator